MTTNAIVDAEAAALGTPTVNSDAAGLDANVDVEVLRSVPRGFAIDCADHANWLARKVVEARAYADRVKAYAEKELRRAAREEQTLMFLFGKQLEAWARSEIRKFSGRRKSLSLPAATVGYRTVGLRLVVDDERAVLAWARQHCPPAVVTTEKLAKSTLDDYVQKTGDIPADGAHVDPGGERFYIK